MPFDRRSFIMATAATGLASLARPLWAAIDPGLKKLLDEIAFDYLKTSPEALSYLGMDKGDYAWARAKWSDGSPAARAKAIADASRYGQILARIDRNSLKGHDGLLYDAVGYCLDLGKAGGRFAYGGVGTFGGGSPYAISQQGGAYQNAPEFLDTMHRVEVKADADAYLARLNGLATVINQETDQVAHDAGLGVIAPDFILDTTLTQLKELRAKPAAQSRLVESLVRRTTAKNIAGDWAGQATSIVSGKIYPAWDRQIALLTRLRAKATHDAGVWKLPQGEAYYAWQLMNATSTTMSPEEVHKLGLDQGKELDARMDAVLRAQGMTQGTVGERLSALTKDPKQLFPNTDAGKEEAVAYVNTKIEELRALLPRFSHMQLKAPLTVKRVPKDIEAGASLGYMNPGALDGSRPSIYYINLKDSANWPRYSIPTLSAHEGIPGHTWQFAYAAEHQNDVPLLFNLLGFNAYTEGWALYAEQSVDELGFYAKDPFGQLGMYQALRFRASRLVTDTGLHAKRWSREQAIDYLTSSTGRSRVACTSEVDRYCASPGQACGYKVGHTEIVRLREKAKADLGPKFDVRDFNDAVIEAGQLPLTVLATAVDAYVAEKKG
jgi:uncharacterized protein (DUF885 family)